MTKDTNNTLEKCVEELMVQLDSSGASLAAKQAGLAELITSSISQAQPDASPPLNSGKGSTQLAEESELPHSRGLEEALREAYPNLTDEQMEIWVQTT
jgi:hypothetical protein